MNRSAENRIPHDDSINAEQPVTADDADDFHCDCEQPGYFHSGVPGILARIENGRVAEGATIERCDLCQRFRSDAAARARLKELGIA